MARRVLLGLLAAAALAACASVEPSGPLDAEAVYRARCALCHPPWSPTDFSPAEWPRFVRKYAPRAGLTPAERDAVLAYLVREAGRR
jgi:trimethylamine-N-oxide reductase (cytochrome c)